MLDRKAVGEATVRFSGKLFQWNEERGFGFIRPDGGGQDVFVHVSTLPLPRPTVHESLTFEIALNAEGKKKAVHVRRQEVESAGLAADRRRTAPAARRRPRRKAAVGIFSVMVWLAVVAIAWFALSGPGSPWTRVASWLPFAGAKAPPPGFTCDGRTQCFQMKSCKEAKLFLAHCPGVMMDGDHDGTPCERDLCSWW